MEDELIIVKLLGGLGNQLFQYAAARRLSYKHNAVLKIDNSYFGKDESRAYNLSAFNVKEEFATSEEIEHLARHNVVIEKHFHFEPRILLLPDNVYMVGYWQSEKYFKDIEPIIRQELTVRIPQAGKNKEIATKIQKTQSVSLHIRRGDSVYSRRASYHGICSLRYYQRCVSCIAKRVSLAHFFIFSDDILWAKEHLHLSFPMTFVEHNDDLTNYEDLRLMSQCKHNVVANSTFSWWGAWLNSNMEKIVCVPKKWFRGWRPRTNTKDLFPHSWVII